jgi:hypothetical protein
MEIGEEHRRLVHLSSSSPFVGPNTHRQLYVIALGHSFRPYFFLIIFSLFPGSFIDVSMRACRCSVSSHFPFCFLAFAMGPMSERNHFIIFRLD